MPATTTLPTAIVPNTVMKLVDLNRLTNCTVGSTKVRIGEIEGMFGSCGMVRRGKNKDKLEVWLLGRHFPGKNHAKKLFLDPEATCEIIEHTVGHVSLR